MIRLAILGSGNGTNYEAIQYAIEAGTLPAEVVGVVADRPDAGILHRADEHGHAKFFLDCSPYKTKLEGRAEERLLSMLAEWRVDYVVLAGFMRMLKTALITAYSHRIVNIHPSLLPSFPGLHAWKQALDYGVKVTGCTVHFVDGGMDTGPILLQRTVPVFGDDTPDSLHGRIQEQEHLAYPDALRLLANNRVSVLDRKVIVK